MRPVFAEDRHIVAENLRKSQVDTFDRSRFELDHLDILRKQL